MFLQADRIVEQLQSYVTSYDLSSLYDYWAYLNHRLFSRLEQRYMSSVRKLEVGLLKYYVTYASQTNKTDKVLEFFERMATELQNQTEFKDWFSKLHSNIPFFYSLLSSCLCHPYSFLARIPSYRFWPFICLNKLKIPFI